MSLSLFSVLKLVFKLRMYLFSIMLFVRRIYTTNPSIYCAIAMGFALSSRNSHVINQISSIWSSAVIILAAALYDF